MSGDPQKPDVASTGGGTFSAAPPGETIAETYVYCLDHRHPYRSS
jgi:hypothetical protein